MIVKKNRRILIKFLKKFLFWLIYGKIRGIISAKGNKKIFIKKVKFNDKSVYNIYKINKCSIISNSVSDTAYVYKNLLVKEPSYQFRFKKNDKIYNGKIETNSVLVYGIQNLKKKINGTLISLLSGGAAKKNYWHWIFDTLPKLGIIEKLNIIFFDKFFLVPSLIYKFQIDTLLALGIKKNKIINGEKNKHIAADLVISTDHPINKKNNPTASITKIPIWIIKWLQKKYLKKKIINKKFVNNKFKKIFIDRSSNLREIKNYKEVKKIFLKYNYKFIKPENYTFFQQISLFNYAQTIAGIHGAGFANIVFCNKNSNIIEFLSKETGNVIKNLSNRCGLNYFGLAENNISNNLKYQNFIINVNIKKLIKVLNKINNKAG